MLRAAERRWIEGAFPEPPINRSICYIFETAALAIGAEVAADVAVPAAIGAGEAAAAGGTAAITLPELAITAPAVIGGGEGALGAGVTGALGVGAGAAGSVDFGGAGVGLGGGVDTLAAGASGLSDALGAAPTSISTGTAPVSAGASGINVTPLSNTTLPAGTSVGGPAAASPVAPAEIGLSPTATGNLGGDFGGGGLAPGETGAELGPGTKLTSGSLTGTGAASGGPVSGSSSGGIFSGLDKTLTDATGVSLRDIGTVGSIGGLGMNILNRNQTLPGQKQVGQAASTLNATAQAQANEARTLENYLNTGTLPPGLAQGFRSATEAAKAAIRSNHATHGTSGSSAEMQDMQAAEDRATAAAADMALKLFQQGTTLSGMAVNTESLSAQLYNEIYKDALANDEALGKAIGSFSAALAGGGTAGSTGNTITLKAA